MTINERLKLVRKTLRYSGAKFGEIVGYTDSYISMVERGTRMYSDPSRIHPRFIDAVCSKFNVSKEWLFTGNGEMFVTEESVEPERKIGRDAIVEATLNLFELLTPEGQDVVLDFVQEIVEKANEIREKK